MMKPQRPEWLPEVDLRGQTPDAYKVETRIEVVHDKEIFPWIVLGAIAKLPTAEEDQFVAAYFSHGVTDDSCKPTFCLFMDLVGARLLNVRNGLVTLSASVPGLVSPSGCFKVPSKPYDVDSFEWCKRCKDGYSHRLVPGEVEDDEQLWERLRGATLRITIGPPRP